MPILVSLNDLPKNTVIIDVRTSGEHHEVALKQPHHLVELSHFNPQEVIKEYDLNNKPVALLCKSGRRSFQAAEMLEETGLRDVRVIKGGIDAIEEKKLRRGGVISMERQVRIAAGSLVILSLVLGRYIAADFLWIGAFVGLGLVYAGISNTCGMAKILSLMPWNKN